VQIGIHFMNFTLPAGPAGLRKALGDTAIAAEEAGVSRFTAMDHWFQMEHFADAHDPMLEGYSVLNFVAAKTEKMSLGLLVTGVTYRHPALLAKTVTTLDVLSGGRAMLGIGAAWYEREHLALGVPYPPVAERFERLEETLQICLQMWHGDEKPYRGKHYTLERPLNSPQSLTRPHPPIMVGGGGERKTLRLVAQYADACNLFAGRDEARKLDVLRAHCAAVGRDYDTIYKTAYYYFDPAKGAQRLVDELGALAELGFAAAIGAVAGVWDVAPVEMIGAEVIPVVADF
jgi:F420-dependent oxidoreductase-like protein